MMLKRESVLSIQGTLQSYLGLLDHGNTYHLRKEVMNQFWLLNVDDG